MALPPFRVELLTMSLRFSLTTAGVALGAALLIASPVTQAQAPAKPAPSPNQTLPVPIRLQAFGVNMSNIATGLTGMVDIRIDKWSTAAERQKIITTMVEKGQNQLLDMLQDLPTKGRLSFPTIQGPDPMNMRLGWPVRYTWTTPLPEGGNRIVVALDRYMSFWEVRNQPRTVDYPFTLIEIHMPKDGKGEGKMAFETKITFDKKKNTVELENYSTEPVRLNEITYVK
jgi:hypothetical protein